MSYEDVAQRQSSATCHQCPSMLKDMDSLRRHLDRAYRDSRDGSSAAYDPAQASELSKAPFACPFGDVDGIFEFSRLKYHVETVHQHCLPQQALRFDSYDYAKSWIESLWKTNKTWVCRRSGRHPYTERSYEFGGDHLASRPYQKPTWFR
ncbi:unnamed protein product (mitochondrion) [Plasmodiophora brassicae]|uniref:Uncharacterized protein n=1 Tax=Plasmodiophora brassicae TaxID=37360 RepID=A0A3P3YNV5_PLABS|nr:unnamed protein product [Plasmodiophora brassicae]